MPKPGDYFVIGKGSSVSALTIETFTGSPYYHAGIYVSTGRVIEAAPDGVQYAALDAWTNSSILWSDVNLSDEQRRQVVATARGLLGVPYSWLDILALGLSTWGITPEWVWDRLARNDRLICSQLVVRCYRAAAIDLCPGKADCRVTPGDLADVILGQVVPKDR